MPQPLHDTLSDPRAELGLLAALQETPALAWRLAGQLTAGHFTAPDRAEAFTCLMTDALADRQPPRLVDDLPATDPDTAARRVAGLAVLRVVDQQLPRLGQQITRAAAGELPVADVLAAIEADLPRPGVSVEVLLPYGRGDLLNRIHTSGEVDEVDHTGEGTLVRGRVNEDLAGELAPYLLSATSR